MDELTDLMSEKEYLKKVYLIGKCYSFGKAVAAARQNLSTMRCDIEFVSNELHPISKVKDFMSHACKIAASGVQAVII